MALYFLQALRMQHTFAKFNRMALSAVLHHIGLHFSDDWNFKRFQLDYVNYKCSNSTKKKWLFALFRRSAVGLHPWRGATFIPASRCQTMVALSSYHGVPVKPCKLWCDSGFDAERLLEEKIKKPQRAATAGVYWRYQAAEEERNKHSVSFIFR